MWNLRNMCNRSAKLSHFINDRGESTAKVDDANSDTRFGRLIGGTVALIRWVSIHGDLAATLMILWVGQSSTLPTILHNDECHPPSYDTVNSCARGGQIRRRHVDVRW